MLCGIAALLAGQSEDLFAQDSTAVAKRKKAVVFFQSSSPLDITITVNLKRLRGDRGDSVPWRSATLTTVSSDGVSKTIPLKLRTRGIWRKKKCDYPPIRMNFAKEAVKGTEFEGLDKPKLVSFCRDTDLHEQYVIEEYQLYRVNQLLTPYSHKVRLVRLSYVDSASGKLEAKRYAIIQEEPDALAARFEGKIVKEKGARGEDLDDHGIAMFGLFSYMIGNTDISITAQHNAELLALPEGALMAVAYDFDFSGAINTTYATPEPRLRLENVRTRLYRGYCVDAAVFMKSVSRFNAQKEPIFALYSDQIGKLIIDRRRRSVLDYFDEFYRTVNNSGELKSRIIESCLDRLKSDAPNI